MDNRGSCQRKNSSGYLATQLFSPKRVFKTAYLLLCLVRVKMGNINKEITVKECSLVKAVVFPVVMYGCESWTVMKAER